MSNSSKSYKSANNFSSSKTTKAMKDSNVINISDNSINMYKVPNFRTTTISDQPRTNRNIPNTTQPMNPVTPPSGTTPGTPINGTMPAPGTTPGTPINGTMPAPGTTPGIPPSGTMRSPSATPSTPPSGTMRTPSTTPSTPPNGTIHYPGAAPFGGITTPGNNNYTNNNRTPYIYGTIPNNIQEPNGPMPMPYVNYGATPNIPMQMPYMNYSNCPCVPNHMLMPNTNIYNAPMGAPLLPLYGYDNSDELDQDVDYMKQLYPSTVRSIQREVDDECDKLEYDGSFIYDEYPDKTSIDRIIDAIYERIRELEEEAVEANFINYRSRNRRNNVRDIISLLLLNELFNRRRRYRSRRRWF